MGGNYIMWAHIFDVIDRDGNQLIDFRDYLFTLSIAKNGTPEEKLFLAFQMFDMGTFQLQTDLTIHAR